MDGKTIDVLDHAHGSQAVTWDLHVYAGGKHRQSPGHTADAAVAAFIRNVEAELRDKTEERARRAQRGEEVLST